ncbi:S24 family peptidase [Thermus caldilimi]|uniref:S24 family peptidase n=1 Tax=Thermus caldilimi TaxID=2483360 RepID=UPI0010768E5E|nr:S24 family peptidase [Thermus caldilimi]
MSLVWEGLDPKSLSQMKPKEFGSFLREVRQRKGLRQHQVAARAGLHPAYISKVELGERDIRRMKATTASAILRAYGLSEDIIDALLRFWRKPQSLPEPPEPVSEKEEGEPLYPVTLPIVDAGAGSPSWDDAREFVTLFLPELKGKRNQIFGIRIVGDSMEPLLYEGDVAVVWTEGGYDPGAIVAIGIPGNGIVVKQLYYAQKGEPLMHSLNPRYPDEPLPEGAKIWGPVIQIIRSLPNGKPKKKLLT